MVGQGFIAGFGHDKTVSDLSAESFDSDRVIDGQNHARLQDRLIACHQLWFFQKAEACGPATAEGIVMACALDHLGIGGVDAFGGDAGAQGGKGCGDLIIRMSARMGVTSAQPPAGSRSSR